MLLIRNEQMAAFRRDRERQLVAWIVQQVRQHDGALIQEWPTELLDHRVHTAVERARRFDIRDPWSLVEYFVAMAKHGPLFDTVPEMERLLSDPALPPDEKIHTAWQKVPGKAWAQAARLAAPSWW